MASTSTGAQNDVTGDGTTYTCTWDTEIYDQNSDFASNTFTAPVTGRYLLTTIIQISGLEAASNAGGTNIVTSNRSYAFANMAWGTARNSSNILVVNDGTMADMDSADTATITVQISSGTKVVDISGTAISYFGGNLIC